MKNLVKALGLITFVGGVWKLGKLAGCTSMAVELGNHPEKAQEINDVLHGVKDQIRSTIKKTEPEEGDMTETESVEVEAEPEEE